MSKLTEAQKVFNKFIRERDRRETETEGYFTCISCDSELSTDQMNAGHFIPVSVSPALRFDEFNVNGQCVYCNMTNDKTVQQGYVRGITKKYGNKVIEYLNLNKFERTNYSSLTLQELSERYRGLINDMNKGIEINHAQL